jgi:hypothetical protein
MSSKNILYGFEVVLHGRIIETVYETDDIFVGCDSIEEVLEAIRAQLILDGYDKGVKVEVGKFTK